MHKHISHRILSPIHIPKAYIPYNTISIKKCNTNITLEDSVIGPYKFLPSQRKPLYDI